MEEGPRGAPVLPPVLSLVGGGPGGGVGLGLGALCASVEEDQWALEELLE